MNKKTILITTVIIALLIVGGLLISNLGPTGNAIASGQYSMEDVVEHNTAEDCWTAINGKVYELTNFIALGVHKPGIEKGCGVDATERFSGHSDKSKANIEKYYIGDLAN